MLTKKGIVDRVAEHTGYAKSQLREILDVAFDELRKELSSPDAETISIRDFGTFKVNKKGPKRCYDFKTRASVLNSARRKIEFTPCTDLALILKRGDQRDETDEIR